jgi:Icc-related predicted phosphoesterase
MGADVRSPAISGTAPLVRIAAVGDLHVGLDEASARSHFERLSSLADLLLLAGDLTQHGMPEEAELLANELARLSVPVFAVLGNHDYHSGHQDRIRAILEDAGVAVLEGEGRTVKISGVCIGVAGTKGFGGGFFGACATEFGEPEMKAFIRHTKMIAERFHAALSSLECDVRIALLHYSPAEGTLLGERLEIYPFLGSYTLGEAIDRSGCALALHGHAHRGTERGITSGGVPVRNVARPVIQRAYKVYELQPSRVDRNVYDHRTMI